MNAVCNAQLHVHRRRQNKTKKISTKSSFETMFKYCLKLQIKISNNTQGIRQEFIEGTQKLLLQISTLEYHASSD